MSTNNIIMRDASDSFDAWMIAQAMTDAGAEVISVVNNGFAAPKFGQPAHLEDWIRPQKFIVFARYRAPVTPDKIDKKISTAYTKLEKQRK